MKSLNQLAVVSLVTLALGTLAQAQEVGKPAPNFMLPGSDGQTYSLEQLTKEGKIVVLEWFNPDCPYVKKHYDSGNMQKLQAAFNKPGEKKHPIVWLAVDSSGSRSAGDLQKALKKWNAHAQAVLMDQDGKVGKGLYHARTTPHMFVIDAQGTLVYNGAIDSVASADAEDIAKSKNYVQAALDALLGGVKVAHASTQPYGCSVKYP